MNTLLTTLVGTALHYPPLAVYLWEWVTRDKSTLWSPLFDGAQCLDVDGDDLTEMNAWTNKYPSGMTHPTLPCV